MPTQPTQPAESTYVTVYAKTKHLSKYDRLSHCVSQRHHRSKFEVNCPFLAGDITTFILAILKRNIRVLKCFRILAPLHVTVSKVTFSKDRSVLKSTE